MGLQAQNLPQQINPAPRPPEASIAQDAPHPFLPAKLAASEAAQPLGVATQSLRMRMARVIFVQD